MDAGDGLISVMAGRKARSAVSRLNPAIHVFPRLA
jgi:hypothetical protein